MSYCANQQTDRIECSPCACGAQVAAELALANQQEAS